MATSTRPSVAFPSIELSGLDLISWLAYYDQVIPFELLVGGVVVEREDVLKLVMRLSGPSCCRQCGLTALGFGRT